jgi:hypothetical protein
MKVHPIIFFCTIAVAIVVVVAMFSKPWEDRPPAPFTTLAQEEILGEVDGRAMGEKWAVQHRGIPSQLRLDQAADGGAPNGGPAASGVGNEAWKRGFKRGFESGYKKTDDRATKPAFD